VVARAELAEPVKRQGGGLSTGVEVEGGGGWVGWGEGGVGWGCRERGEGGWGAGSGAAYPMVRMKSFRRSKGTAHEIVA
jgi:hypothetical protein